MLGFFILIAAIFLVYSILQTGRYRQLRQREVSQTVSYESERIARVIAEMERNVIDLANAGEIFYQVNIHNSMYPASHIASDAFTSREKLGEYIATENFSSFTTAIGGGIWFEPYVIDSTQKRICFYAFYDAEIQGVRYDPSFQTEEYDYHNMMWYQELSAELCSPNEVDWVPPYIDATGTHTMMTTVGAGIFDENGTFVGMATVDWEIQNVMNRLTRIKPTPNSFVLLASVDDNYIVSNTYPGMENNIGEALSSLHFVTDLIYSDDGRVRISEFVYQGVDYYGFSRQFENDWLFSIHIPKNEIYAEIEAYNKHFIAIFVFTCASLLLLISLLLSTLINQPLKKLTNGVLQLGKGNLDKKIEIHTNDEIGALATTFNEMTTQLKLYIEQSAKEQAEKDRISTELNVAKEIQTSMLPSVFPPFPERKEFDIYATMQPAKEVGGDFYDFFLIDQDTLAVVMADVSGKGIPAALFMTVTKILIKNTAKSGKSPKEVFEKVNQLLCENNKAEMFVTAFIGYLDIPSGRFTFVNAGHNPPLVRINGRWDWLKARGGFVLAGMKNMVYRQNEIAFKSGDEIFLYTDGITEAVNKDLALFSEARLLQKIQNYPDIPLKDFCLNIKKEIDLFADGAEQADDITMLALRIK